MKREFTKEKQVRMNYRLPLKLRQLVMAAAAAAGESRAEFFRCSVRERAIKVLKQSSTANPVV
jgi:uncharacterized protein (DUF1778 family)